MEIKKVKAIVKWYDGNGCGYGFAFCEALNEDIFIHSKEVPDDIELEEGDIITCEIQIKKKGYVGKRIVKYENQ